MPLKRNRHVANQMPEVNLVPMMDVILTILIFFIVVSMTLGKQQGSLNVTLPNSKVPTPSVANQPAPDPLVVSINAQGQLGVKDRTVNEGEMTREATSFLSSNPQAVVLIKADKKVSYEELAKVLGTLQRIGGERVSLAVESN